MFYEFRQNNSYGRFDYDYEAGISVHVIIEAPSVNMAVGKAKDIGLYFNGVNYGDDCGCCGDRWYEPWRDVGTSEPVIYGESVDQYGLIQPSWMSKWIKDGYEGFIHFLDGRKVGFWGPEGPGLEK